MLGGGDACRSSEFSARAVDRKILLTVGLRGLKKTFIILNTTIYYNIKFDICGGSMFQIDLEVMKYIYTKNFFN